MEKIKLVCVFGSSGSGKTHFCNRVEKLLKYKNVHCIGHVKHDLEKLYNLPKGSLDTPEGKKFIPPNGLSCMGDILVSLYHFWNEHDPRYSTRGLYPILKDYIDRGENITLNAIRNPAEGEMINTLKKEYESNLKVIKIWINREENKGIITDIHQRKIFSDINSEDTLEVENKMQYNCFDLLITNLLGVL